MQDTAVIEQYIIIAKGQIKLFDRLDIDHARYQGVLCDKKSKEELGGRRTLWRGKRSNQQLIRRAVKTLMIEQITSPTERIGKRGDTRRAESDLIRGLEPERQ